MLDASEPTTPDGQSLHQRILTEISDKITSGEWQPGFRIPFEHELTVLYSCSRMTVSKALSQLAAQGLIERRKRSGSFVARQKSQAAVLEIHDIRTEVEALGLTYNYRLLGQKRRKSSAGDRVLLDVVGRTRLIEIIALHSAGALPFCLEERLISVAAVPEAEGVNFNEVAPSAWLIGHVPWSKATHTIGAVGASEAVAAALRIAIGAPCLTIERRTWTSDQPVTHVRLTYPGNAHLLVAHFSP
jgi:GntR family transcriptional regulator, histidine utilization repressor